jgi:type IV pilus assembly protein PilB
MPFRREARLAARDDEATAIVSSDDVPAQSSAPPAAGWRRLGDLLLANARVTHGQIAEALLQQSASGKQIGRLLVELGAIDDRDLARALAQQMGLEQVDLATSQPDPEALARLPESLARAESAVPLRIDGGELLVIVSEPSKGLAEQLRVAAEMPVRMAVGTAAEIARTLDASYRALTGVDEHVEAFRQSEADRPRQQATRTVEQTSDDAPVVQLVNKILAQALRDRSSDVHIEPQDDRLRIRFRIDGALHDVLALPSEIGPAVVSRLKIMANMNIVERRRPQDGQMAVVIDGREVDVRVATVGVHWGEKVVLRILDKSRTLFRLSDLGMPPDTHEQFSRLIRAPFGMVICAGPTGSGKTTTLYAALSEINEAQRNIMTIEDPVEYVFPSINQMQTNDTAGLTFATGLKSILRQDPDVILVGESRDVDTARIAVQSAMTGHQVLSSLHSTDAVAALHRFLDMGIESFLVASSVLAVVGQRLVRVTCDACRAPYQPSVEELAFYNDSGGAPKYSWTAGRGCHLCANTGYRDRTGVYELLRISPEIKRLIVGWATQDELRRMAISQGMRTLQDEAIRLVTSDVTTIAEVVRSIYAF